MLQYILKRLLLFLPTVLFVTLILFLLLRVIPGDAINAALESESRFQFSEADLRLVREQLGLDEPIHIQYLKWVWGAVRFDFGISFWGKQDINQLLQERMGRTISIAVGGLLVAVVWGVASGVISAVKQNTWIDNLVRILTVAGLAMPSFFIAVLMYFFLIMWFDWIPPIGYESFLDDPLQNLKQIVAPVLILGFNAGASISRLTRSQLLEVFREDFVRTARAKGLRENIVILRHALPNSLLPVVTLAGLSVGGLLAGVVVIERVFAIPGMGTALLQGISQRDYPVVQAFVWCISLIFMTSNLLVDISYAWIDPRIRYK